MAGTALLLGAFLAALLFIAGNTDSGRRIIENLTRRLTSGHVSISGLGGSFPRQLTLDQLQLSDAHGVWLIAESVTLNWSPWALLARRVEIATLHVSNVDMQRLPDSSSSARRGEPVSIPRIDVANLAIDVLKLGSQLAGRSASLVLSGNAHLRSVKDMLIDVTAKRIDGDGAYELHLRFDPTHMDVAMELHEPAGGPLENLLQLPGLGALSVTGNLSGPLAAEHLNLSADAGAFRGRAQGQVNLSDGSADLDFAFDSPALAPRPDLAWQRVSVHGSWHGSVTAPRAEARIAVDQLQLPGGARLAALNGEFSAGTGKATLHAVLSGVRITGPHPQLLQDSPVAIDASLQLDQPTRPLDLSLSHRLFSLHGSAETVARSAGKRSAVLELRLPDLAPLAVLGGPNVRGSALLKAQLQSEAETTHISLDGSAALIVGTESWSSALGDHPTLQLSGAVTDRALTLNSLKFSSRSVSVTGSGKILGSPPGSQDQSPVIVHARWVMEVSDLSCLSPALAGTLKASGDLDGPSTSLTSTARLISTLAIRDSSSGTLSADIKLQDMPTAPSGTVRVQGSLDGAPLHVDVAMTRGAAGSSRILIHRADWKSAHAEGDITMASAPAVSHGQLSLQIQRLAD
ncbi:MAG: hypothetical protein ABSE43_10125, partial [Steroidobacteraceae bacterium]